MSPLLILAIVFVVLTVMGIPLFVSVGLTTALALFLIDIPYTLLAQTGYGSLTPFPLLTIPLFVLAGRLMEVGGMANRMIAIATNLVGAYRGSMGLVTVFACMLFAALSGSGPATTAAIGSVTVPAMKRDGYDVPFAASITASAGALGSLIPPSNLMIIYGLVSETSIPRLFLAGLIPGLFVTILLMITTYIIARRRNYGGDGDPFTWEPFLKAAWDGKWAIGAPILILGGIYGGAFTPTALASQYPDLNVYGLPLIFDSEDEAAYVRERMDERLRLGLEDSGFVSFGFAGGGFAVIMSSTPVRSLEDLKGQRVWVPEGDTISYASMEALSLSPVTLPITDVLTGLQTGLIDIVAMSPIGALVLQWHTKIKYMTEMPLVYTMGFMAVDKKAFGKLSAADREIVREVMTRTYENFDRVNPIDNAGAREALVNAGIETVEIDDAEIARVRQVLRQSNRRIGERGDFTIEFYDTMLGHVDEYRRNRDTGSFVLIDEVTNATVGAGMILGETA